MTTCREGPIVSLKGSPTVSPVTAALCPSEPLPPCAPLSMYFFALSQAPPEVFKNNAINIPETVANINIPAMALAPNSGWPVNKPINLNMIPTAQGPATARTPGFTIAFNADAATIATQRA